MGVVVATWKFISVLKKSHKKEEKTPQIFQEYWKLCNFKNEAKTLFNCHKARQDTYHVTLTTKKRHLAPGVLFRWNKQKPPRFNEKKVVIVFALKKCQLSVKLLNGALFITLWLKRGAKNTENTRGRTGGRNTFGHGWDLSQLNFEERRSLL